MRDEVNITEFLEARITEDEVSATLRECHREDCGWIPDESGYSYPCDCGLPERMARECKAKRAIIAEHEPVDYSGIGMDSPNACAQCGADLQMGDWDWIQDSFPCKTTRTLAAVYADHPDYQQAWAHGN